MLEQIVCVRLLRNVRDKQKSHTQTQMTKERKKKNQIYPRLNWMSQWKFLRIPSEFVCVCVCMHYPDFLYKRFDISIAIRIGFCVKKKENMCRVCRIHCAGFFVANKFYRTTYCHWFILLHFLRLLPAIPLCSALVNFFPFSISYNSHVWFALFPKCTFIFIVLCMVRFGKSKQWKSSKKCFGKFIPNCKF